MKKSSKVLSSVLIASMLVGSLTACGKSDKKTESNEVTEASDVTEATEATTEEIKGEALVDPAYIHPGSYNDLEDPFGDTSDYWYPEGDVNADYFIMFTQTSHDFSNIGLDIEIDTLNDDHTFVEQIIESNGDVSEEMTGTWEIKASNVCWLIYDNPEDAGPDAVDVTQALGAVDEMENAKQSEADAEAAEAQAKEDAKNSGSPYEQPEDKKDLSGVNLDQTPDVEVVDGAWDYDTFNDFKSKYELQLP